MFQLRAESALYFQTQVPNKKTFFWLLPLLFDGISFNPGPINGSQQYKHDQYAFFKQRGLYFVRLNINSLLSKLDELQYIAKLSTAVVNGIGESNSDDSILSSEN